MQKGALAKSKESGSSGKFNYGTGSSSTTSENSIKSKNSSKGSSANEQVFGAFNFRRGRRDSVARGRGSGSAKSAQCRSKSTSPFPVRKAITDLSGVHPKRRAANLSITKRKGKLKRASTASSAKSKRKPLLSEKDKDWFLVRPVSAHPRLEAEFEKRAKEVEDLPKLKKTDSILAKEKFLEEFPDILIPSPVLSPKFGKFVKSSPSYSGRPKTAPSFLKGESESGASRNGKTLLAMTLQTKSLSKSQFRKKRFEKEATEVSRSIQDVFSDLKIEDKPAAFDEGSKLQGKLTSIPPLNARNVKAQHVPQAIDKFRIEQVTLRRLKYVYEQESKKTSIKIQERKNVGTDHWAMLQLLEHSKVPISLIRKYFPQCNTFYDLKDIFTQKLWKTANENAMSKEYDNDSVNMKPNISTEDIRASSSNNQWANVPIWVLKKVVQGMRAQYQIEEPEIEMNGLDNISKHEREMYEQAKDMLRLYEEDEMRALYAAQQAREQYERNKRNSASAAHQANDEKKRQVLAFKRQISESGNSNVGGENGDLMTLNSIAATLRPKTAPIKLGFTPTPDWIVHLKMKGFTGGNKLHAKSSANNKTLVTDTPSTVDQQWIKDMIVSRSIKRSETTRTRQLTSREIQNYIRSIDTLRP